MYEKRLYCKGRLLGVKSVDNEFMLVAYYSQRDELGVWCDRIKLGRITKSGKVRWIRKSNIGMPSDAEKIGIIGGTPCVAQYESSYDEFAVLGPGDKAVYVFGVRTIRDDATDSDTAVLLDCDYKRHQPVAIHKTPRGAIYLSNHDEVDLIDLTDAYNTPKWVACPHINAFDPSNDHSSIYRITATGNMFAIVSTRKPGSDTSTDLLLRVVLEDKRFVFTPVYWFTETYHVIRDFDVSPDGKTLAVSFIGNYSVKEVKGVYLYDISNSNVRLTASYDLNGEFLAFSEDGMTLGVLSRYYHKFWIIDL